MTIVESPSPNHGPRPAGAVVDLLVIHGTAGSDQGDLSWCRTPAPANPAPVSYHYLILRDGTVHRLVQEERRAWHSGASSWQGRADCNNYAIGVGLSNKGPGEEYTKAQLMALVALTLDILRRNPAITRERIVAHAAVAPGRKTDPWAHFPWDGYRKALS